MSIANTKKLLAIFLAAAAVCGLLFWIMSQVTDQDPNFVNQTPSEPVRLVDLCSENERLETQLTDLIANSGRCESDADCSFVYLSCPFGCFNAVSNASVSSIRALHEDYLNTKDECPGCVYRCMNSEMFQATCDSGLCTVSDAETWILSGHQPSQEPSSVIP